jgi:branched-chain amino acid transport system substrate-binding protein
MLRRHLLTLSAYGLALPWHQAQAADPGITDKDILLGQSAVLSGPLGVSMQGFNAGALLAFEDANAKGGINGRRVKLVSIDDELKPDRAVANYKTLIGEQQVLACFGGVGSGPVAAAVPVLREAGVPLIGNYAVGDSARDQAKGVAYFVRTSYRRETAKIVQHLSTLGIDRIAVAHLDNPGGAEVLALTREAMKTYAGGKDVLASAPVRNDGGLLEAAIKTLSAAQPQAVLMFLSGPPVSKLMAGMWDQGVSPSFYGTSVVAGERAAAELGTRLRSLTICQVMPYPWTQVDPVAHSYQQLCEAAKVPLSYYSFEGYLNALVMLEALRRAGREPSRAGLHTAMKSLKMRLAGMDLDFSDGSTGSKFTELVQVSNSGRFMR